ncbi:MAG: hypothetical protein QY328_01760 [Anaerolineales bacterium]|nr:MAG: hypothetical protein QY328_01760 [Anaerolineales bacterium]
MRPELDWLFELKRREIIFLALLVLCGGVIGFICGRVSHQYLELFFPFAQALESAAWVLGILLVTSMVITLVSAFLRPLRVLLFGHALGAIAFLLVWRGGWIALAGAILYMAGMTLHAWILTGELGRRLEFSMRPLLYEQRKIFMVLALLLSLSFASGYQSAAQDELRIPENFKQAAEEMMLAGLENQVNHQPDLDSIQREIFLEQARTNLDDTWNDLEATVQPYVRFIPLGLILPLYFLLMGLLDSLGWLPYLLLWLAFRLLNRFGILRTITETSERKILKL